MQELSAWSVNLALFSCQRRSTRPMKAGIKSGKCLTTLSSFIMIYDDNVDSATLWAGGYF